MQRQRADGGHRLRAVQQRDAFLRFELKRRNFRAPQSFRARHSLALVKCFAFADYSQCQMSQRGQIAAGSD